MLQVNCHSILVLGAVLKYCDSIPVTSLTSDHRLYILRTGEYRIAGNFRKSSYKLDFGNKFSELGCFEIIRVR